jgi:hypothetical protein
MKSAKKKTDRQTNFYIYIYASLTDCLLKILMNVVQILGTGDDN